ncbi:tobamovirus multiplication protein 1 [Capsicum chacoense]|uniref:Tobamovirus multiplication protein 1 n=1 Tax=Capsicum annuum TaxID=4072 RepID=A0A1U8DW50_CAPAN|nr:tobamovirus multiplication protein 1 [Capsicum annuum]KAF3658751.1 Tobamovirus multiplication protein 1 [Capsicum annuum]PHT64152.1 Tobamovirus multiplication protein 1 [Capsicum annuum]
MLKSKSFFLELAKGYDDGVDIFGWWNRMLKATDDGKQGIFYALCAAYAFVSFIALVQLIRIQLRLSGIGWTTQKVFHLMNFVVCGLRAILFGVYRSVFYLRPKALEMMLLDLPGLLFFSTYTLLVLFWAEIFHQARNLPIDKLRPTYYAVNAVIYIIQICIWIFIRVGSTSAGVEIAKLFLAIISLCAALGFIMYGGRLFAMLRRFPIESRGRQKKLHEVGFVTGICCTCFLIRCVVVAISAFNGSADVDVIDHPVLILFYYLVVEIVPSILVLYILRKLPPKRVSEQYHPIQ